MALPTAQDRKEQALREELWPGAEGRIWKSPKEEKGWFSGPRILPLLLHLLNDKAIIGRKKGGNCAAVYVELLARNRGHGIVEIGNEGEHAYLAGYPGPRGLRTWREHMRAFATAGFIEVSSRANQPLGAVLILHPRRVVAGLRKRGLLPGDEWWNTYKRLQMGYGAFLPSEDEGDEKLTLIEGLKATEPKRKKSRKQGGK